jgi:hypothetical protein
MSDAISMVRRDNPDLAKEYDTEINGQ